MIRFTVAFDTRRLLRPWAAMAGFAVLSAWFVLATYGLYGYPIGADAQAFWAMVHAKFERYAGVYLPGPGLGINGSELLPIVFPLLAFALSLSALGVGGEAVARIVYICFSFAAMSGTYVLIRELLQGRVTDGRRNIAAVTGAVLYGLNQWPIAALSLPVVDFTLTTAVLPWAAWGAAYAVRIGWLRGTSLIALWFVLGGVGNPARFAAIPLITVVFALGTGLDLHRFWRAARILVLGVALGLICCLWWLLPLPTIVSAGFSAISLQGHHWLDWMSERSTLLRLYKLGGGLIVPGLRYDWWYANPIANVLGYIPIAIALLGLGRIRRRLSLVLFATFVAGILLAKGTQPPLGRVYQYLVDYLPGFSIFRSPWDKWIIIPALALSVLFAFGTVALGADLERALGARRRLRWTPIAGAVGVLSVLIYAWPALAGFDLKPLPAGYSFTGYVPSAYRSITSYIRHVDPASRVIVFNEGLLPFARFGWGYIGDDPLFTLSSNPIASFGDVLNGFDGIDAAKLAAFFQRVSARFIIVHYDVTNPEDSPKIARLVRAGVARSLAQTTYLGLYELTKTPAPFVRAPAQIYRMQGGPWVRTPAEDASAGRPEFDANWSAVASNHGAPVSFVYAPKPDPVLGSSREIQPVRRGATLAVATEPGEALFYAPTAIFGHFDEGISCATLALNLRTRWRSPWTLDGTALGPGRPARCGRTSANPSLSADGIIALGLSQKRRSLDSGGARLFARIAPFPFQSAIRWRGHGQTVRRDGAGRPAIRFVGGPSSSITASGRMDPQDSYALELRYSTRSEALIRYSDARTTNDTYLTNDGSPHTMRVHIFPSRINDGRYTVGIFVFNGAIDIFASTLRVAGPNGTFFALKRAAQSNDVTISGLRWNLRRGADFEVRNCVRCAIEGAINGDGSWIVLPRPAVAEQTLGMAHDSGSFRALSPGMAGWVLTTPGSARASLRFEPRRRFRFGLLLSVAGVVVLLALALLGQIRRRPPERASPQEVAPATALQGVVAAAFLCSAPFVDILSERSAAVLGTALLAGAFAAALAGARSPKRDLTGSSITVVPSSAPGP